MTDDGLLGDGVADDMIGRRAPVKPPGGEGVAVGETIVVFRETGRGARRAPDQMLIRDYGRSGQGSAEVRFPATLATAVADAIMSLSVLPGTERQQGRSRLFRDNFLWQIEFTITREGGSRWTENHAVTVLALTAQQAIAEMTRRWPAASVVKVFRDRRYGDEGVIISAGSLPPGVPGGDD